VVCGMCVDGSARRSPEGIIPVSDWKDKPRQPVSVLEIGHRISQQRSGLLTTGMHLSWTLTGHFKTPPWKTVEQRP
jgi:hypothetical protein